MKGFADFWLLWPKTVILYKNADSMNKPIALLIMLSIAASLQAQVVGAIPDSTRLQQPFGTADALTFRQPDKIYYPETWFHFLNGSIGK